MPLRAAIADLTRRTHAAITDHTQRSQTTRRRPPIPRYPGDLVQIDTWLHSIVPGYAIYQISILDVVTRYVSTYFCCAPSSTAAARGIEQAIRAFPFTLRAVQHDVGPEFAGAFAAFCEQHGIRRYQLPPRSPKLNARVERIHLIASGAHPRKDEYWNAYSLPYWNIADLRPVL